MKKFLLMIGFIAAVLLAYYCLNDHSTKIQADISSRLTTALQGQNLPNNINADVSGRDVTLAGSVSSEDSKIRAGQVAKNLYGVRVVNNNINVVEPPPMDQPIEQPMVKENPSFDLDILTPPMPEIEAPEMAMPEVPEMPTIQEPEIVVQAEDLVIETPAPEMKIVEVKDACQDDLMAMLNNEQINFTSGSATIQRNSYGLLNRISAAAKKCNNSVITINGYTDNSGNLEANTRLSLARAKSVGKYLISKGIRQEIRVVGNGPNNPIADNATAEGRGKNRRIEFKVVKKAN